jgi:hypothetical protein
MLIRRAIRRLGFNDAVAWFHVPHPGFLAKALGEKLTVFYCIDEYSKLPDVDAVSVQKMDDELTAAADIVFACNQSLLDARRSLNANMHRLAARRGHGTVRAGQFARYPNSRRSKGSCLGRSSAFGDWSINGLISAFWNI